MCLSLEVIDDLLNRVWPEATVDHLGVLQKGLHRVVRVDVPRVELQVAVNVREFIEGWGIVVEEAGTALVVFGVVEILKHLFVAEVSHGDNIGLSVSWI